jgi:hypothetical protein
MRPFSPFSSIHHTRDALLCGSSNSPFRHPGEGRDPVQSMIPRRGLFVLFLGWLSAFSRTEVLLYWVPAFAWITEGVGQRRTIKPSEMTNEGERVFKNLIVE